MRVRHALCGVAVFCATAGVARAAPASQRAHTRPFVADPGVLVESVDVEVAGLPLRRPLRRALVNRATGEVHVAADFGPVPPWRGDPILIDEAEAVRLVDDSGYLGSAGATQARLVAEPRATETVAVWLVDPPPDARTMSNPLFAVDAHTGEVMRLFDQASSVRVRAFFRNPALDPDTGVFATQQFHDGAQQLRGPVFAANNCLPGDIGDPCVPLPLATPTNPAGDFLYHPPDVDDPGAVRATLDAFAEVSLYYHADKFMAWLGQFGVTSVGCSSTRPAALVANYRMITAEGWQAFNNARYTGRCNEMFIFGQGDEVDYAYDGDVVAHEIAHAVIDEVGGGGRLGAPRLRQDALVVDASALNEAMADFLSAAHSGDPLLGEYIGAYGAGGTAIRNNANAFTCPASFLGDAHADSEAFAGALWQARELWGNAVVRIVLATLPLLPEDASMEDASAALVGVTRWQLGPGPAATMEALLRARGLLSCRRVVPLAQLRAEIQVQPPEYAVPYAPPPLQVEVGVPPAARSMRLRFRAEVEGGVFPAHEGTIVPGVLIKYATPFAYSYDASAGWPPRLVHGADRMFEQLVDGDIEVDVTPGVNVYVAFVNGGDEVMRVEDIEVSFDEDAVDSDGPEPGDTGEMPATDSITDTLGLEPPDEKAGCSCRTPPGGGAALLWWLLPLLYRRAATRR